MKRTLNHYSQSFKQQVLDDYFQSGMSQVECYTKWKIPKRTFNTWLTSCRSQEKSVSLQRLLISKPFSYSGQPF